MGGGSIKRRSQAGSIGVAAARSARLRFGRHKNLNKGVKVDAASLPAVRPSALDPAAQG